MPQIMVTAEASGPDGAAMTLRERVSAADFESERFLANLLERLGWAVEDATVAEQRGLPSVRAESESEHRATPHPDPAGVA